MNTGGILSGLKIMKSVADGDIHITPFDSGHVDFGDRLNPASYDLTLGSQIAVYTSVVVPDFTCESYHSSMEFGKVIRGRPGERVRPRQWEDREMARPGQNCLDAAQSNPVSTYTMDDGGFVLVPGVGYLMHTVEKIHTDKYVPIIDGKSSIGRLFCFVHVTAGYGDPGFDGQYTLEVGVWHPLVVYPGMRFCQMRFHTLVGEVDNYKKKGNYTGVLAEGPVPSRSWKMFGPKTHGQKA